VRRIPRLEQHLNLDSDSLTLELRHISCLLLSETRRCEAKHVGTMLDQCSCYQRESSSVISFDTACPRFTSCNTCAAPNNLDKLTLCRAALSFVVLSPIRLAAVMTETSVERARNARQNCRHFGSGLAVCELDGSRRWRPNLAVRVDQDQSFPHGSGF
jgi:hypothetical protein